MMKTLFKPALAAGIALAVLSAPAAAQVNGIAMMRAPIAIAQSQALTTAFQTIETQYAAQIAQIGQLSQQARYDTRVRQMAGGECRPHGQNHVGRRETLE